jgi:hypothetical protein
VVLVLLPPPKRRSRIVKLVQGGQRQQQRPVGVNPRVRAIVVGASRTTLVDPPAHRPPVPPPPTPADRDPNEGDAATPKGGEFRLVPFKEGLVVSVGLGRGTLDRHHRVNNTRTLWLVISFSTQADMNCCWNNRHGESSKTLTLQFYY